MEALYLATAQQLLGVLRGVNETVRSVMLIGHNPGMHELAVSLAGGSHDRVERRLPHRGSSPNSPSPRSGSNSTRRARRLVRFLTPRDLQETAT